MFPGAILLAVYCLESDRVEFAALWRLRRIGGGAQVRWGRRKDRTARDAILAIHLVSMTIEGPGKPSQLLFVKVLRYDDTRIVIDTTMLAFSVVLHMGYGA
jgi:hypothetical protein